MSTNVSKNSSTFNIKNPFSRWCKNTLRCSVFQSMLIWCIRNWCIIYFRFSDATYHLGFRERESGRERESVCVCMRACMCVCFPRPCEEFVIRTHLVTYENWMYWFGFWKSKCYLSFIQISIYKSTDLSHSVDIYLSMYLCLFVSLSRDVQVA